MRPLSVPESSAASSIPSDTAELSALAESAARLREQVGRKVVGQTEVVDLLLTALFAGGHGLFVGVPGLAKTLLVSSLAAVSYTHLTLPTTPYV